VYDQGVFDDLAAAIKDLDIPVERDCLVEAIALRDRLDARIARPSEPSRPPAGGPSSTPRRR
jgi:hypothetical protein